MGYKDILEKAAPFILAGVILAFLFASRPPNGNNGDQVSANISGFDVNGV